MLGDKIKLSNGKTIKVTPLDAVRLHLDTSNIAFLHSETEENNSHIISISFENKVIIRKRDKFSIILGNVKTICEVRYMIIEKKGKSVIIYTTLPTKSGLFLLPALGRSANQLKINTYYTNTYIDNTYKFLYVVYRFTGTDIYKEFEKQMITDPLCISHIEHGKYHVAYIFRIPSEFKEDVLSFVEGKYSKFSKVLKGRIRRFHGNEGSKPMINVIDQNKDLKKEIEKYLGMELPENSELASKPENKIEIYKLQDK